MATPLEITFRTDRFRLTGDLPPEANAGNRMYGEDFAKWIVAELPRWPLDHMDEDWGWLVASGEVPDARQPDRMVQHLIGVYAYPDDAQHAAGSDLGDWMLCVQKREKRSTRPLGLFTREQWVDVDFDPDLADALCASLVRLGIRDIGRSDG